MTSRPDDKLMNALQDIKSDLPAARTNLSEDDKDTIVQKLGPNTVKGIIEMKRKTAASRIPFLFSSIDTQLVVDILAHDFTAAIARGQAAKVAKKTAKKSIP